ncbi:unnamed protein product [marine sediment metagenome]|uniref:Uncharacterized protein n=1 Tax=marine sediment metagenome TaxID=412755 RepID=X1PWM2_9ZZZZ
MEEEIKHKCVECGCRLFKVSYSEGGMIEVYCKDCDCPALITMISMTSIPAEKFKFPRIDKEGKK